MSEPETEPDSPPIANFTSFVLQSINRGMARPTDYNQTIADQICERMASGETLTHIVKSEGMPDRTTVWRWQRANEEFRNAYMESRIEQAHFWADEIIDISDDGSRDYRESGDRGPVVDTDHISRSRLRVDTRKFLMAKVVPKIYGDKLTQEITGPDGGLIQTKQHVSPDMEAQILRIAAIQQGLTPPSFTRTDEETARFAEMVAEARGKLT